MWIDSHCHLAGSEYDADREEVFARAKAAGVEACVVIGAGDGLAANEKGVALAAAKKEAYATVGVHPHDTGKIVIASPDGAKQSQSYLDTLRAWAARPKVVAIGEIGLDYHYDHSPRDVQQLRFCEQLQLAKELNLPVVIHSREAWEDTVSLVKELGPFENSGVFHCFGGSVDQAEEVIALGFYISISGILTFKKAASLIEVVQKIPLEHMIIETDAPFLAPVPHRGKRNEPAFVALVGEKIAGIRGTPVSEVAEIVTNNTKKLFRI